MEIKEMDILQLSYFIEAAQTMSFRKVSQRYYTSQPSVSNSISNLETELGAKLFNRTAHGVSLTAAGHELLPYAVSVLDSLQTAKSRIRDMHNSATGSVYIACIPGASQVLAECLKAFTASYPDLYVDIKVVDGNGQIAAMDEDRFDFVFGGFHRKPNASKSEVFLIRRGFLSLILPRSQYPEPWLVSFTDLAERSFIAISPSGDPLLYEQVMSCCKNRGFSPYIVGFYSEAHAIITAVRASVGISLLPSHLVGIMPEDILSIPLEGEDARYDSYVSWKKNSSNIAAQHFLQIVQNMIKLEDTPT